MTAKADARAIPLVYRIKDLAEMDEEAVDILLTAYVADIKAKVQAERERLCPGISGDEPADAGAEP